MINRLRELHKMKKILLINTGGTFNKVYDPLSGKLPIDLTSSALKEIAEKWLCTFKIINIIGKDSLDMNDEDRAKLTQTILLSTYDYTIVIHGTDTMHITAKYLSDKKLKKHIVLTGAMVPYAIDPVEATANLASAFGYLQTLTNEGVIIAMNGVFGSYDKVQKDREIGRFTYHCDIN